MAQDYANNILEAIEMIAAKRVNEAGYDKTIKAVVTSADQAAAGQYTCKYESVAFTAIGAENAYTIGDLVMVNIPQNNWDNPKTILNKIYSEVIDYGTVDPFSTFLDVNDGQPLIYTTTDYVALKANILSWSSRTLVEEMELASVYTEPYTRMGIEISFKTKDLKNFNVNGGTYGVRIIFSNAETNAILAQLELNTLNCFGNLYGFEDYSPQKVLVKIDPNIISASSRVRVECFQANDFTRYNTQTGATEPLVYPTPDPDFNIFFKDLRLYFGYGIDEYKDGDVILTTDSSIQYYDRWSDEENKKHFTWIYWYKDNEGKMVRDINHEGIVYANINDKDWFVLKGRNIGEFTYSIEKDWLSYDSFQIRVGIERDTFNTDSSERTQMVYSNTITFYRYEPPVSSIEYDEINAIKMFYDYEGKTEIEYNKMENQLLNQYEFFAPHSIHIDWNPTTPSFKDPTYLRGATVTWKVPAFDYEGLVAQNEYYKATARFNFETTTVIMRPRAGFEYGENNNTVRFEEIDGISYMVWDITLAGPDWYGEGGFIYDEKARNSEYYWGNDDQTDCDTMKALTLWIRPKEFYLPSMVNNRIYCVITKDDREFTGYYDIPIAKVDLSETEHHTFIFTEDFEKPYLLVDSNTKMVQEKLFHFCMYQKEYDNKGTINQTEEIRLLRPFPSFDETDENFLPFLNNYGEKICEYYPQDPTIDPTLQDLNMPEATSDLKYNFILRVDEEEEGGAPPVAKYYFYYFNILPIGTALLENYVRASTITELAAFDPLEIYYMEVPLYSPQQYPKSLRCVKLGDNNKYKIYRSLVVTSTEWVPTEWEECPLDTIVKSVSNNNYIIKLGSPNAEEYEMMEERSAGAAQRYQVNTRQVCIGSNGISVLFEHYKTYTKVNTSTEVDPPPIAIYTIEGSKEDYIQNTITPLLTSINLIGTDILRKGYWYYDENNNYVASTKSNPLGSNLQWLSLKCASSVWSEVNPYNFLVLQTKIKGICSLREVSIYENLANYNYMRILNGMNKIYCDASGVIKENLMGPSEIPYGFYELLNTSNPVINYIHKFGEFTRDIIIDGIQPVITISYEADKSNIFYPTINFNSKDYLSNYKKLNINEVIPSDPRYAFEYCIKLHNDFIQGQGYQNKIIWQDKGVILRQISVPYSVTAEDIEENAIYKYKYEKSVGFLNFDNIGFTENYKEAGMGNDYPLETIILFYNKANWAPTLPIIFQQRQLFRDDFNQWNGKSVYVGEDAVYSPVIGAGRKFNGEFTGCLMGDIATIDLSQSGNRNYFGLYGYKDNVQSFGLMANGTMFIGKNGDGQLVFDGNKATIQSSLYASSNKAKGMLIDFDDGIINMKNQANNENYFVKLDVSNSNLSTTDKPLKIGTGTNPKFSVEWDGTIHAKDVIIDSGTLSGVLAADTATINNVSNMTVKNITIKNSDDGDMFKTDSEGNILLTAGIKLGTNGKILNKSGNSSIDVNNNYLTLHNVLSDGITMYSGNAISFLSGGSGSASASISSSKLDLGTATFKFGGYDVHLLTVTIDGTTYYVLGHT